jgi:SAM-dependent methyltransferase
MMQGFAAQSARRAHAGSARRALLSRAAGSALGVLALLQVHSWLPAVHAQTATGGPSRSATTVDEDRPPVRGQPGKDVMWLPTPDELMHRLFDAAAISAKDLVYDLGAGDGRVAIAAARRHGARAVGIEYDGRLARHAQRNVERAGLASLVRIIEGDIFKMDFSAATVLTLYLLEELNQQLRPTILAMRPGTRVVSYTFSMGDWEPDQVITVGQHTGYFWRVPASVQGRWILELPELGRPAQLEFTQRYQRLAGTMIRDGRSRALLGPEIDGTSLTFRFVDDSGLMQAVKGELDGDRFQGRIVPPYGMVDGVPAIYRVSGRRVQRD